MHIEWMELEEKKNHHIMLQILSPMHMLIFNQ